MAKKTSTSGETPEKASAKPRGRAKASKPVVLPLGDHLAALLNPALVGQSGFAEAPAPYDPKETRSVEAAILSRSSRNSRRKATSPRP